MSSRSRVLAAGRRLGVYPSGRRVVCPSCGGSGRVHDADGPWQLWVTTQRFERIVAEHEGREYECTEPEPDEPMQPCWTCDGTGEVTEGALAQHESEIRAFEAGHVRDVVSERIEAIIRAFARFPGPAADDDDGPPTLRAVPDD